MCLGIKIDVFFAPTLRASSANAAQGYCKRSTRRWPWPCAVTAESTCLDAVFGTLEQKSCRDFLRGSELESDARLIACAEEPDAKKARLECQPDSNACRNLGARLVVHPDECALITEFQVDFVAKLDVVAVALLVNLVDDAVGEVGLGQRELDFFHTACCYISRFFVAYLLRKPMHPYIH